MPSSSDPLYDSSEGNESEMEKELACLLCTLCLVLRVRKTDTDRNGIFHRAAILCRADIAFR